MIETESMYAANRATIAILYFFVQPIWVKKLHPAPCTVFASPWWCTGGRQSDLGRLTMSAQGEQFFDMHNQRPPTSAAVRKVTFVVVVVFYNTLYKGSWPWLSYQLFVCEGQQGGFNYLVKEQRNSTGVSLRGNGWKHQTCNLSAKHALSVNEQRLIPPLCENLNNLTFMFTVTLFSVVTLGAFLECWLWPLLWPQNSLQILAYSVDLSATWSDFEFTVPPHSKGLLCQGV